MLLAGANALDPAANRSGGPFRQDEALLRKVVEGIERRLAVSRPRQRSGMVAGLLPQQHGVGNERLEQPQ